MTLQPIGKRLLVQREKLEKKSALILPEERVKSNIAKIISIGKDVTQVEVGQKVLLMTHAGQRYMNELEEDMVLVGEDEIIGIIT